MTVQVRCPMATPGWLDGRKTANRGRGLCGPQEGLYFPCRVPSHAAESQCFPSKAPSPHTRGQYVDNGTGFAVQGATAMHRRLGKTGVLVLLAAALMLLATSPGHGQQVRTAQHA